MYTKEEVDVQMALYGVFITDPFEVGRSFSIYYDSQR